MERRVAAVLAADMVGFSRLVERDEVGTLKRQKRHLHELIKPSIAAKGGKVIKLTGDGLIAEFSSAVEALQCAVLVQREMAARESQTSEDTRIKYRMAIHLGDLVFDEGDIYGDSVNVAARLETIAEPGGVVISGTTYDVLKANVDVAYKFLGERQLKNIATPVRVYQVTEGLPVLPKNKFPQWLGASLIVSIVIALGFAGLFWGVNKSKSVEALITDLSRDISEGQFLAAKATVELIGASLESLELPQRERTLSDLAAKIRAIGEDSDPNQQDKRELSIGIFDVIKSSGSNSLQDYFSPRELAGLDLVGIDFSDIELRGVSFAGAFLINSRFDRSNISSVDFTETSLRSVTFFGTKLEDNDFRQSDWFNSLGLNLDAFSKADLGKLEPCPGGRQDFIDFHDERYFYKLEELPDKLRRALLERWSRYSSEGGICDRIAQTQLNAPAEQVQGTE